MLSRSFLNKLVPLIETPFVQHFTNSVVAPGNQEFIATEDLFTITTEDNVGLVTEG